MAMTAPPFQTYLKNKRIPSVPRLNLATGDQKRKGGGAETEQIKVARSEFETRPTRFRNVLQKIIF